MRIENEKRFVGGLVVGFLVWAGVMAQVPPPFGPGIDTFESIAEIDLQIGPEIAVTGPVVVERMAPDPSGVIETEMLQMELTGSSPLGPVSVRVGRQFGLPPSTGTITPRPSNPSRADSFFDVFFEVSVEGGPTLRNQQPVRMQAEIKTNELPPL